MLRNLMILALMAAVAVTGFSQEKKSKGKPMTTEQATPGAVENRHAVISTSMGDIEIELYGNDAPKTVENFTKLAEEKFYDGMRWHRVIRNFVIQTGDENSKDPAKANLWGTGGKSIWGKPFTDELNPATPSYKAGYKKGVVAMANAGPNTNQSQFFICLADVGLPHNYTIFGKVTKGQDVVDKIGAVPTGAGDRPKDDVMLKSIRIKK